MGKTFSIADLHGRADLLDMAIEKIEQAATSGKIVFTGDYVDRGPTSREVVERLMAGPADPENWEWVCLRGNHEEIMTEGCLGRLNWWLPNGGGATLISYGASEGGDAFKATQLVPTEHLQWMASLPVIHQDDKRLFVHAGVDPTIPLDEQTEHDNTWMLYPDGFEDGFGDLHVVHGHHQHQDGPLLFSGRSNFDTLAWYTGRLVVGVFDDDVPGGPVSTIEVVGPTFMELMSKAD